MFVIVCLEPPKFGKKINIATYGTSNIFFSELLSVHLGGYAGISSKFRDTHVRSISMSGSQTVSNDPRENPA